MSPIGTSGSPLRSASSTSLRKTGEEDGEGEERNGRGGRKESQNPPERRKKKTKRGGEEYRVYNQMNVEHIYAYMPYAVAKVQQAALKPAIVLPCHCSLSFHSHLSDPCGCRQSPSLQQCGHGVCWSWGCSTMQCSALVAGWR